MLSFHLPLQSTLNGLDTFRHVNNQKWAFFRPHRGFFSCPALFPLFQEFATSIKSGHEPSNYHIYML